LQIENSMKRSRQYSFLILLTLFLLHSNALPNKTELADARQLFYQSVENKQYLDSAIIAFKRLNYDAQIDSGLVNTYIGALYSLKGKHAFWPQEKLKWVNQGLKIMDEAIQQTPDNIEARFIRGTTTFYLPFFFNRQESAQADFREIIRLLPGYYLEYETQLILNVIDFLEKNTQLTAKERTQLLNIKNDLKLNAF